jgi:hypothetical protein
MVSPSSPSRPVTMRAASMIFSRLSGVARLLEGDTQATVPLAVAI